MFNINTNKRKLFKEKKIHLLYVEKFFFFRNTEKDDFYKKFR